MQLFYDSTIQDEYHTLSLEQSHHAVSVMRCVVGQSLNVCDGRGTLFLCRIIEAHKRATVIRVIDREPFGQQNEVKIHLAIAPTKNIERLEWAVEKMTEIGVSEITPIICSRSERKTVRIDRLQKIIISAAEQSLKGYLPRLNEPTTFGEFIALHRGGFIAHCIDSQKIPLPMGLAHYTIMIGPEGDFSPDEVSAALAHNHSAVTLGLSRLRTETAAVCAVTLAGCREPTMLNL